MELQWKLNTNPPDHGHWQVGGLEYVNEKLVEHQPAGAVCCGQHERRLQSIKPKKIVNYPAKSNNDSTESLDADQLVHNGVPLTRDVPRPEKIEVHQDIEQGLQQQKRVQYIFAHKKGNE